MSQKVSVIGAGSFGTALAHLLAERHQVLLYGRDLKLIEQIKRGRENKKYLPGIFLQPSIQLSSKIEEALKFSDFIVLAVPMKGLRATLGQVFPEKKVLLTTKGLEKETFHTAYAVACEFFPKENIALLSGPNLAREVASGLPCASVVASRNLELAYNFQKLLSGGMFRVYLSEDVKGVSLGGALKNVYAIGAGICSGYQLGTNALASYICRALAEMTRISSTFGVRKETLFGLSGLGDLVCTCTSSLSRNFTVGRMLAEGKSLQEIEKRQVSVAEGIATTKVLVSYAKEKNIELPIAEEIHRVLYEGESAKKAIFSLLQRPLKEEKL